MFNNLKNLIIKKISNKLDKFYENIISNEQHIIDRITKEVSTILNEFLFNLQKNIGKAPQKQVKFKEPDLKEYEYESFEDCGINSDSLSSFRNIGYDIPNTLQSECLKLIKEGENILVTSGKGSGKTSFIYLCSYLFKSNQALFLSSNPENADYLNYLLSFNGKNYTSSTPIKIKEYLDSFNHIAKKIKFIAIDNYEEMINSKYEPYISFILNKLPEHVQIIVTMAKFNQSAEKLLKNRQFKKLSIQPIKIFNFNVSKVNSFTNIDFSKEDYMILIFENKNLYLSKYKEELSMKRINFLGIWSNQSLLEKEKNLHQFRIGEFKLILTDISNIKYSIYKECKVIHISSD